MDAQTPTTDGGYRATQNLRFEDATKKPYWNV